jgi:spore coat protein H
MKLTLILSGLFLMVSTAVQANPPETGDFPEIRIYIAKGEYISLRADSGEKMKLSKPVMLLNNDTANVKEIHARGNNSLKFQRKSLSVELDKAIKIQTGHGKLSLKKFNLLNLVMDKNLWHNRWADMNLSKIGLLPLFNTYCKVWINDEPQGFYLLIEKPQQSRGKLESPYMLRRGPDHTITDEYFDDKDKDLAKKYKKQFHTIYSNIHSLSGDVLATQLQELINLENYYYFLAFNYLVMNGDYADEVFFFIAPKNQRFDVIAWDYDDILKSGPHEGRVERNRRFPDKKLFSLEESLDVAIAGNDQLYTSYERSMRKMLGTLDSAYLSSTAFQVINELEQLSQDQSMANVTLFLDKQPFNLSQAKQDILYSLDLILKRRKWILGELKPF